MERPMSPGKWVCSDCTLVNEADVLECDACTSPRPLQPITEVELEEAAAKEEVDDSDNDTPQTALEPQDSGNSNINNELDANKGQDTVNGDDVNASAPDSPNDARASAVIAQALAHGDGDGSPDAAIKDPELSRQLTEDAGIASQWIRGFCVVDFHIDIGFVVEESYPKNVFTKEELTALSFMSFPDCNSSLLGDYVYSFRFPLHRYLSRECPPIDGFQYGYTLFRQTKDATRGRGYFQKAIVLITHQPFTKFFTDVIQLVAPLYFECGKEVLEAAAHNIALWPAPIPGEVYELPILGSVFLLQVPYQYLPTDICSYVSPNNPSRDPETPGKGSSTLDASVVSPNTRAIQRIAAEESQRNRRLSYVRRVMMAPASPPQSQASMSSYTGSGPYDTSSIFFTAVSNPSAQVTPSPSRRPLHLSSPDHSHHQRTPSAGPSVPRHLSAEIEPDRRRLSEDGEGSGRRSSRTAPSSPSRSASRRRSVSMSPGPTMGKRHVSQVPRYYFEDINIYQAVGPRLLPHLWTLWELLLTGKPVVVKSTVPSSASNFVLAMVGLLSPLTYRGDYRPYFTVNDPVFNKYSSRKGHDLPSVILGVTNPIFLKIFSEWPTIVKVGDPVASRSDEGSLSRERRASILVKHKQELTTSYKAIVPQNKAILKKLSPRQDDRMNNQILRRHFMQLTESFLGAFSRYFEWNITPRPDNVWFVASHPRLPVFDEEVFIAELAAYHARAGKLSSLNVSKGAQLYRAFIRSVNFRPWFDARRTESLGHYANLCRHLKFESDVASMVADLDEVRQVDLAMKIRDALERENALPEPDTEIVAKLRGDLYIATSVLPSELQESLRPSTPT